MEIVWEGLLQMDGASVALMTGQRSDPAAILDISDFYRVLEWIRKYSNQRYVTPDSQHSNRPTEEAHGCADMCA